MSETKIQEIVKCSDCKEISDDDIKTISGSVICNKCFEDDYINCSECELAASKVNASFCRDCEDYFCQRCSTVSHCEPCDEYYCDNCDGHYGSESHNESPDTSDIPYRDNDVDEKKFLDKENQGSIVKSIRTFGVEIETYYPNTEALNIVAGKSADAMGIAEDGSLGNYGIEFQTPLLSGKKGERFIKFLSNLLSENKFTVDTSCGLHIHLDGEEYKGMSVTAFENVRRLWLFYFFFDDVLLAMLPISRRKNRYCLPLKRNYGYNEIINSFNMESLQKRWYKLENNEESDDNLKRRKGSKQDDTRYNGINFHSLFWDGHLEIRYHSGTISDKKILEWINLHARILDSVPNMDVFSMNTENMLTLTQKMNHMFSLLNLEKASEEYLRARVKKFYPSIDDEETLLLTKNQ